MNSECLVNLELSSNSKSPVHYIFHSIDRYIIHVLPAKINCNKNEKQMTKSKVDSISGTMGTLWHIIGHRGDNPQLQC